MLGGCGDNQSVLNPKGPEALQLAHLSWLLFAFGTIVLLLVVLATAAAIRGPQPLRSQLASARTVVWAGIVFPAVTLTALLGYGVWLTRASTVHHSYRKGGQPKSDQRPTQGAEAPAPNKSWEPGRKGQGGEGLSKGYGGSGGKGTGPSGPEDKSDG